MEYFIEVNTIIFILYELFLLNFNLVLNYDRIITYITLVLQNILLINSYYNLNLLWKFSHYTYWIVIFIVLIFSKNNYLLILIFISLLLTFITRHLTNECLYLSKYNKKDKNISKLTTNINISLIIIMIFKLIYVNIFHKNHTI